MEVEVNIFIDYDYPINYHLNPKFTLGDKLSNQGAHSEVRIACIKNDCNYIAKIIPVGTDFNEPDCYTENDLTRYELLITKEMSEIGVAPLIYDMSLSDTEGIMIMDKYDGTLTDLLFFYQKDKSLPVDKILQSIEKLMDKMHQNGIVHRDLSTDNILYTKDNLVAIADFGISFYSTSETLRDIDRNFLRAIREIYEKIRQGQMFEHPDDIPLDLTFFDFPIVKFFWNGHECPDWQ